MVRFTEDTMVQPIASEWFGFYAEGQDDTTISLQNSTLYQQDWIGMKTLDEQNKLQFFSVVGDHLQFTDEWFYENMIPLLDNSL